MSDPQYSIQQTRCGKLRFLKHDDPIGRSLHEFGEWAGLELNLLSQLIQPGHTVIDIGANIGTHTIEFAHRVGSQGRVIAFEPQPRVLALLKENVQTAHATNVTVVGKAVGSAPGQTKVDALPEDGHANYGAARVSKSGAIPVEMVAIDSLKLAACDLIKIDAEGYGGDVLAGAANTIARLKPVLFVECNDAADAVELMRSEPLSTYDLYFVSSPAFNFHNFRHNPVNTFGVATETSVLAIPRGAGIGLPRVDEVLIEPVRTLDDLVLRVLSAPRFGDQTIFDRSSTQLELVRLSNELDRARLREMNLQRQIAILRNTAPPASQMERLIARLRPTPLWRMLAPVRALARRYIEKSGV